MFLGVWVALLSGVVGALLHKKYDQFRRQGELLRRAGLLDADPDSRRRLGERSSTEDLERAVEAIAIEVERISEGQRFVTKLLAERARELPAGAHRSPVSPIPSPGRPASPTSA
jgi:hypothetical protein